MMNFVQEYLDGERSCLNVDLDFSHYLIKHYGKMERADAELAECFNFYLAEEGFDHHLMSVYRINPHVAMRVYLILIKGFKQH